jgi:hypothetical protein
LWDISTDAADSLFVDVPTVPPAVLVPTLLPNNVTMPMFAAVSALASASEPTCALTQTVTMPMPTPMPIVAYGPDAPWPVNTDLIYVPGTTRIMLTAQHPMMQTVIHDTFEKVHTLLLFDCAFPDASVLPPIIRDALITAASFNVPRVSNIYCQLLKDNKYATKLGHLVSLFTG